MVALILCENMAFKKLVLAIYTTSNFACQMHPLDLNHKLGHYNEFYCMVIELNFYFLRSTQIHKVRKNIAITDPVDFITTHSMGVEQQGKAANGLFGLQAI